MTAFVYTPPGKETPRIEIKKAEHQPPEGLRLDVRVHEPFMTYPVSVRFMSMDKIGVVTRDQIMAPQEEVKRAARAYVAQEESK